MIASCCVVKLQEVKVGLNVESAAHIKINETILQQNFQVKIDSFVLLYLMVF